MDDITTALATHAHTPHRSKGFLGELEYAILRMGLSVVLPKTFSAEVMWQRPPISFLLLQLFFPHFLSQAWSMLSSHFFLSDLQPVFRFCFVSGTCIMQLSRNHGRIPGDSVEVRQPIMINHDFLSG